MIVLTYFILSVFVIAGILVNRHRGIITGLMILFLGGQIMLTANAFRAIGSIQFGYFYIDALGLIFLTLLTVLSCTTVFHGLYNLRPDSTRRFQYYHAALAGLIASITAAMLASNITVTWVFVEATTLTASVLIYHEKNKLTLEAAWKYVFVCSTGIAIAYMGILFLGMAIQGKGSFDMSFEMMSRIVHTANPLYLKIAFLFVLVGYSTKMELFPMHTAGVDANSVAHPQIGAFISTAMVNLGFVAFFRVFKMFHHTSILPWMNNVLMLTGVLSVMVAAGYMLKARHTKRMLAYSTLEVMGIMAIALGVGGVGYYAAILILVVHSLTKSAMFYQLSQMFRTFHTYMLKEVGNYFHVNPAGALVLLLGMIGILAIPPSGLFWPEYLVFSALVAKGYWLVMLLTIFFLCFLVYGMATRMLHIFYSSPLEQHHEIKAVRPQPAEIVVQLLMLLTGMMLCFYQPEFLKNLITVAILTP